MELGSNIRAIRAEMGLTLDTLAERSGVSRAMLSDIERGTKSPTIRVLSQVAAGLECTLSELLGEDIPQQPDAVQVLRRDQRQALVDPRSGVERQLLSPTFLRRGIEIIWYVIPPGVTTGVFPPHMQGVEEHVTVVRGKLHCLLGGKSFTLEEGDSLSFPADVDHSFHNPGNKPCRYFLVIDSSRTTSAHGRKPIVRVEP